MTTRRRLMVCTLAIAVACLGLEFGATLSIPGISGIVVEAQAIVGRPLTPVSYAGIARRTVRRCVYGAYYC